MAARNAHAEPAATRFVSIALKGMEKIRQSLHHAVTLLRRLSGDDAYERYLQHHAGEHPDVAPLPRGEFERRRQDEKWRGINRCC